MNLAKDIQRHAKEVQNFMRDDLPDIVAVEGLRFIESNFEKQGFVDTGLKKWPKRKTRDSRGRDITRYRTNRVGKKGELNRYGRKNKGRAILVGHNTGGNKLKNSFRAIKSPKRVIFRTYKPYAQIHNEGLDGMPKRQYMGPSKRLDRNIERKITSSLDRIFNN